MNVLYHSWLAGGPVPEPFDPVDVAEGVEMVRAYAPGLVLPRARVRVMGGWRWRERRRTRFFGASRAREE